MVPVDEALRRIRTAWPSNPDRLDNLKDRLTGAQPIPLVPFVGAGLSVPMGFPLWGGFLTALAAECGESDSVTALLRDGKYEDAAAAVEQGLSPEIFNQRVADTFGARKCKACSLQGAVLALPELAGGPVVTTNFDRVLERVFAEAGAPFEHVSWGSQVDAMRRAIADNQPFLLKIHGDAEERSGRVLTRREYDAHYAPGAPDGLRAQLGRAFQGRTLLFVGSSLGQDRTMDVLAEVLKEASGLQHYAIVERPADDKELFARQRLLGQRGILPIWYPLKEHELIEPLLRWIASLRPSPRAAAPELVLERPSQRKTKVRSELDLLIPYQRTTAFVGRHAELECLQTWLRSEAAVSVRVVTGRGGSGKTRLGVELIEWLEEAEPHQWNCGFLTPAEMERFSGLQNLSQWRRRKPVLAVVDYAAGSAERLKAWLEQLAAAEQGGERVRLLLLEREASLDSGWLATAISRGYSAAAVRALLDPPEPVRLEGVAEAAGRREVLRATIEAGAAMRGVEAPSVPPAGADAAFDKRMDDPHWGDPLMVMMAGLTALDTGLVAAMALGRRDLAYRMADRERDRVELFRHGAPLGLLAHMAAYVTASGGLSREDLRHAARAESEAIGRAHPEGWGVLADRVAEALDGEGEVRPVEPDVVGEALLLRVWGGTEVQEGCRAVVRAARVRGRQVAASVVRAAQDFCVGETPRTEPPAWLDGLIAEGKNDPALWWCVEGALPPQTLALRERAVEVERVLAEALRERAEADPNARPARAVVLNKLGNRLSAVGRHEEALEANGDAVKAYRQLTAQHRYAFLPELAGAVGNLGNRLSAVGRREEALEATGEAVGLYRQLAAQRPDAFRPDLAAAVDNLGNRLSALGRREAALQATGEAVGIYRSLAGQRPEVFLPELAIAVNNLGARLSALGRREEALEATGEAVGLYRQLAAQRPDAFLPNLAWTLDSLGSRLSAVGRREEALAATREGVELYRQLVAQHPEAFLPGFAAALDYLGSRLSGVGQPEEALAATVESVGIYRQLAAQRPDAFRHDLAAALDNLGGRLSTMGRREEALAATVESAGLYRQLAAQRPEAFCHDLAAALDNLGSRLGTVGRRQEALAATDESVRLYRQLAAQRPDASRPDLAVALNNLGSRLSAMGQHEHALAATSEAVGLYRDLAAQRPDAFGTGLAAALDNLGGRLGVLGRHEEAVAVTIESVGRYRALAAQRPDASRPDLALALNNLGVRLAALGRHEDALATTAEAADLYRRLAAQRPDAFRPGLAAALDHLGSRLGTLGRHQQGLEVAGEAVALYRQLATRSPAAFLPDLAIALDNSARHLSALGRSTEALAAAGEALRIRQGSAAQRP